MGENMILKEAADKKECLFLPQYMADKEVPTEWSQFINFIDKCYKKADPVEPEFAKKAFMEGGRVRRGMLQIWGYMTIFAEGPTPEDFPEMHFMLDKSVKEYGANSRSAFALTNLSSAENITNRHDDLTHNLYFQCIGSVTWRIYKDKTAEADWDEYVLNPGDAIWVPSGRSHQVFAHVPRTAITIAFEPDENYERPN
jgi:hypothetical protein